jgi:hypothetical protein
MQTVLIKCSSLEDTIHRISQPWLNLPARRCHWEVGLLLVTCPHAGGLWDEDDNNFEQLELAGLGCCYMCASYQTFPQDGTLRRSEQPHWEQNMLKSTLALCKSSRPRAQDLTKSNMRLAQCGAHRADRGWVGTTAGG